MRAALRRADRPRARAFLFLAALLLGFAAARPAAAQFAPPDADAFSLRDVLPPAPIDPEIERAFARREAGDGAGAVELLEPLAKAGDLSAQMALGFMFGRGEGVPRDAARAAMWWRRAADQGQPYALFAFAEAALNGAGMAADATLAHAYLTLAETRTRSRGPFLDLVKLVRGEAAAKLDAAALRASEAIVTAWLAERPALAPPPEGP